MHRVEVFRLLQDFLVAEQPFLLAKLNPQLLKASKYSTASCVLGPLYGSGTFSRHLPDIYRHSTLSLHRWVLQGGRWSRQHAGRFTPTDLGRPPQPREGLVTGRQGPPRPIGTRVGRCATMVTQGSWESRLDDAAVASRGGAGTGSGC
jgi:hypothetical protein